MWNSFKDRALNLVSLGATQTKTIKVKPMISTVNRYVDASRVHLLYINIARTAHGPSFINRVARSNKLSNTLESGTWMAYWKLWMGYPGNFGCLFKQPNDSQESPVAGVPRGSGTCNTGSSRTSAPPGRNTRRIRKTRVLVYAFHRRAQLTAVSNNHH